MRKSTLSIAGKTFLAGEYLALHGGPALILATDPRFQLIVTETPSKANPFHPESPAGLYVLKHKDFFANFTLEFQDPYQNKGGFGASSAQFALVHALKQLGTDVFIEAERFIDWHVMLTEYREIAGAKHRPSGADIVGAVSGAVTWFDRSHGKVQTFGWPFQEHCFALYHTGIKLPTHEHLASLPEFSDEGLVEPMFKILDGLRLVDVQKFVSGLQAFKTELNSRGWVAKHTQDLLAEIETSDDVMFAKGCGAQGSDVIFVLFKNGKLAPQTLAGLKKMSETKDLSPGIKVHP